MVLNGAPGQGGALPLTAAGVYSQPWSAPGPRSDSEVTELSGGAVAGPIGWANETLLLARPDAPAQARVFVARQLLGHGLDHLVDDMSVVVSELATNAVRHAGTPFAIRVEGRPDDILLSVRDGDRSVPAMHPPDLWRASGRGLLLVQALSGDWGISVDGGGKSVWACFDLRATS